MEEKLDRIWLYGMFLLMGAGLLWEDVLVGWVAPAMYGLTTGELVLLGIGCLCGQAFVPAWKQQDIPAAVQRRAARVLGALYLTAAALCPLGLLVSVRLPFDTDFILLAQIAALLALWLLGHMPRRLAGKQYDQRIG